MASGYERKRPKSAASEEPSETGGQDGVRAYVSFRAAFPKGEDPPGRSLAAFLGEQLRLHGVPIGEPMDLEGWAYNLEAEIGNVVVCSTVGLTDDGPVEWQVHSSAYVPGFFRSLFGRYEGERQAVLRNFVGVLHEKVLSADDRFMDIRWYDPESFKRDHGETWFETP